MSLVPTGSYNTGQKRDMSDGVPRAVLSYGSKMHTDLDMGPRAWYEGEPMPAILHHTSTYAGLTRFDSGG